MLMDLSGPPSNPSSVHSFGKDARRLLTQARNTVAKFFRASPDEIIFTSGGTESINLLLRSLGSGHVITSSIEHSCIDSTLRSLKNIDTTFLSPGLSGAMTREQIEQAIRPDTKAIIATLSNAETGVKIDIEAIADLAQQKNIFLFIDAVSYVGKEPLPLHPGISSIAISAHKFHGPKGIGTLWTRSCVKLATQMTGGGQENARRSGTENLAAILGLAEALNILEQEQTAITQKIRDLRDHFEESLIKALPDVRVNGTDPRICNTSNLCFPGIDGETLLIQLDRYGIAASHGSACSSGALEPSRVLLNMGLDRKTARSSIRFSFSRMNTKEEIDTAIKQIIALVTKLHALSISK
jgi:cysteine desulfurase